MYLFLKLCTLKLSVNIVLIFILDSESYSHIYLAFGQLKLFFMMIETSEAVRGIEPERITQTLWHCSRTKDKETLRELSSESLNASSLSIG